jgi:hypothetical protein
VLNLKEPKAAAKLTQERRFLNGIRFSPDGRYIIFLRERKGAPGRGKGEICIVPSVGGEIKVVARNY